MLPRNYACRCSAHGNSRLQRLAVGHPRRGGGLTRLTDAAVVGPMRESR